MDPPLRKPTTKLYCRKCDKPLPHVVLIVGKAKCRQCGAFDYPVRK